MSHALACPYCGKPPTFSATSIHLYHQHDFGPVWECVPCKAYVGCHKGTDRPLGRLANKELRDAKQRAHAAFDPLWRQRAMRGDITQGHARGKAYVWLAGQMGIDRHACHVGMFDVAQCQRVVEICQPYLQAMLDRQRGGR